MRFCVLDEIKTGRIHYICHLKDRNCMSGMKILRGEFKEKLDLLLAYLQL